MAAGFGRIVTRGHDDARRNGGRDDAVHAWAAAVRKRAEGMSGATSVIHNIFNIVRAVRITTLRNNRRLRFTYNRWRWPS